MGMNKISATNITQALYKAYGTDSGVLFGIPPEYQKTIALIVELAIDHYEALQELEQAENG